MAIEVVDKTIRSIEIIDDSEKARESMGYPVEELRLIPVKYAGPIGNLEDLIREIVSTAQAAICDHHLRVGDYSRVNGSDIVARLYQKEFPALLCTRWETADINDMRPLRRYIPVLVNPDELTPDAIVDGI